MSKFLNQTGLSYFWGKIKTVLESKVNKEEGKGLSTFDYDGTQKQKVNKATIDLNSMKGADFAEAGKALKAKIVENGKVTAWEFGDIDTTDKTLSIEDKPADAKAVGDALADKVDVILGKGLSTNDYTTAEKNKLAGIATQATRVLIDNTLSQNGQAADAKITGDTFTDLKRKTSLDTITDIASGPIAHFEDGADNIPMKDVLVHIEPVQAGSGDPSPENVRPITGWTGVKVTRTGKNLVPKLAPGTNTVNGITWTVNNDGSVTVSGTATGTSYLWMYGSVSTPIPSWMYKLAGKTVTASSGNGHFTQSGYASIQVILYGSPTLVIREETATIPSDLSPYTGFAIVLFVNTGNTVDATVYPQFELGSTATKYEPYSGQTYDITFPTEAGTVYGGTLDVTKGELVVDRAFVTISNVRPNGITSNSSRFMFAPIPAKANGRNNFITNMFGHLISADRAGIATGREASGNVEFYLPTTVSQTAEAGIQWFAENPTQLVYELATPLTYNLTPQEITSLLGTNNLWADTGDNEIEYVVETTGSYINKKIKDEKDYVTPEMFGAVGDGVTDDTTALLSALSSGANVVLLKKGAVYSVSNPILDGVNNISVIGYGSTIKVSTNFEFVSYLHRCCLEIENSSNLKFEGITFDASWREIKTAFNLKVDTTLENYCVRLRGDVNGITFYKCIFGNQLRVCIQTQGSYLGGDRTNPANVNSNFIPNKNIDIGYCTFGWNYEESLHNGAIQMLELPQVATDVNTKIHDNLMLMSGVHGIHIYHGNNNVIIENNTVLNSGHCVLEEYYLGGGTIVRGYGIEVTSCNKIIIKNNYVRNFIEGGIFIFEDFWYSSGDIHDIIIDGNIVEQEADYSSELTGSGIFISCVNKGTVTRNICKNLYRQSNMGGDVYGIGIIKSNHIETSGNIISFCENGVIFNRCGKISFASNVVSALNKLQDNNVSVGVNFFSTDDISCVGNLFEKGNSDSTKFDGIQITTVENAVVNGNIIDGLRYGIKDNSGANSNISIYGTIFKSVASKYVWWGTHTDLFIDFVAVADNT